MIKQLPRVERERQVVAAARTAFARDGVNETSLDAVAAEAQVSKALLFKLFRSREELLVAATVQEAGELAGRLDGAGLDQLEPVERVVRMLEAVCEFAAERPEWMDLSVLLLREPIDVLEARAGPGRLLELGQAMARLLGPLVEALEDLGVRDPDMTANSLWLQALGAMFAARHGVGIRALAPGIPARFQIDQEMVKGDFVASVRAAIASGAYGSPLPQAA